MTLTFEPDVDMVNLNHHAKYPRHRLHRYRPNTRTQPIDCFTWTTEQTLKQKNWIMNEWSEA